VILNTS